MQITLSIFLYIYIGMNMGLMLYVLCLDVSVKDKGYKCNELFFFINIFSFHNIINSAIGEIIWHLCRCLGVSMPNYLFFINIFSFRNIINSAIGEIIWYLCRCLGVSVPNYLRCIYSKEEIELELLKFCNEILDVWSISVSCRRMEVSILRPTPIYLSHCNNTKLVNLKNCASVIANTTNINQVTYISFHVHFTAPVNNIVKHKNSSLNYG